MSIELMMRSNNTNINYWYKDHFNSIYMLIVDMILEHSTEIILLDINKVAQDLPL